MILSLVTTVISSQGDCTALSLTPPTSSTTEKERTKTLAANQLTGLHAGPGMGRLLCPEHKSFL